MSSLMFTRSFKLQDMCLIAVIKDIDLFVYNKTIPQSHIDFLLRVYADDIFSKLKILKKESLTEAYMLWFLNPHVKKVAIPYQHCSKNVIGQLKMIGFGITSLNLEYSRISEDKLNAIILCIPHVVNLDLSNTFCSDETLTCIQKSCLNLESLNVSSCWKVTDNGMANLCQGKLLLKVLNVWDSNVHGSGIFTILERMPSLECVKHKMLAHCVFRKSIISPNEKLFNLTELIFSSHNFNLFCRFPVSKIIQAWVKVCPELKKLHFKDPVTEDVLVTCTQFQYLEELKIKLSHKLKTRVYDALTPILPISKNLKTLILSCATISPVILIEYFENLQNLYVKKVSFVPFEEGDIKITKTNLLTLVMKDIDMEVTNIEGICKIISLSTNVTKLYFENIKNFPSELFDVILKSMKNLTKVNFSVVPLDIQFVYPFFYVPTMQTVIMRTSSTLNKNISTSELFRKGTSCNLSWSYVKFFRNQKENFIFSVSKCLSIDNDFDDDDDEFLDYYCYSDESDAISDKCNSDFEDYDDYEDYDDHISWRDCAIDDNDYFSD